MISPFMLMINNLGWTRFEEKIKGENLEISEDEMHLDDFWGFL